MPRGSAAALRSAALTHFAEVGFAAASLQRIADDAGVSKSSVLYHFDSKEALLDAVLRPAISDLEALLRGARLQETDGRRAFLDGFVDYLYGHRLEVAVLVNHGSVLAGIPVIDEADALVRLVSERLCPPGADPREAVRFGVALAGAAFVLVAADRWGASALPDDAVRLLLADVLAEFASLPATYAG